MKHILHDHACDYRRNPATGKRQPLQLLVDEQGDGDWVAWVVLAVIGLALYGGYTLFEHSGDMTAPKTILAVGVFGDRHVQGNADAWCRLFG